MGVGVEQSSRTARGLTIARLHALRVAVLLRVPRYGSHVGHVVALRVGVRRVGRVARHVRRRRVVLWSRRQERRTGLTQSTLLSVPIRRVI